ncbi:MAG TPA: APC family permease, partial [Chitinophagaceae bacterium]|nr:APC family permease [Chitinophagaceae bacterium]
MLAIGVGAVIGWSWVIYAGPWSTYPGSLGGVIAFIIGGILCSFIGLAYAELTSAMPRAGGDMVFTFEGLGQKWAFVTGICMIMAFVGLVTVETLMFPVILEALGLPLVRSGMLYHFAGESVFLTFIAVSIAINALFAYINHRGVGLAGIVQTITVVVLVLASVFFVVSGVSLGTAANAKPLITSAAGISMVMLMVPSFMSGFNAIPQAAEETNVSPRTIGRLVIATVWACVVFYILIIVGLSFAAPAEIRSGGGVVVLSALTNLFQSNAPRVFVAIAALIGMLTSWNAAYLAGSRLLLA